MHGIVYYFELVKPTLGGSWDLKSAYSPRYNRLINLLTKILSELTLLLYQYLTKQEYAMWCRFMHIRRGSMKPRSRPIVCLTTMRRTIKSSIIQTKRNIRNPKISQKDVFPGQINRNKHVETFICSPPTASDRLFRQLPPNHITIATLFHGNNFKGCHQTSVLKTSAP